MKITVVIISKTEKINKMVIKGIDFAEKIIIVVDSPSRKSKSIGKIDYYYRSLNNDFASQRNFALKKAKNNWILFVDEDEYVSCELRREIKLLEENSHFVGYLIPRIDVCFHQPLKHGETGSIYLLRLARKNSGKFERTVHEKWEIDGEVKKLSSPLYHIKDNLVNDFIGRMNLYSNIDADILKKEGKPFTIWRLMFYPTGKFIYNYIIKLGFMDGLAGLFFAYLMSIQSLTVRVFQWVKRR